MNIHSIIKIMILIYKKKEVYMNKLYKIINKVSNVCLTVILILSLICCCQTTFAKNDHGGLIIGTIAGAIIGATSTNGDLSSVIVTTVTGAGIGAIIDECDKHDKQHNHRHHHGKRYNKYHTPPPPHSPIKHMYKKPRDPHRHPPKKRGGR
jgi:hypothetical protein